MWNLQWLNCLNPNASETDKCEWLFEKLPVWHKQYFVRYLPMTVQEFIVAMRDLSRIAQYGYGVTAGYWSTGRGQRSESNLNGNCEAVIHSKVTVDEERSVLEPEKRQTEVILDLNSPEIEKDKNAETAEVVIHDWSVCEKSQANDCGQTKQSKSNESVEKCEIRNSLAIDSEDATVVDVEINVHESQSAEKMSAPGQIKIGSNVENDCSIEAVNESCVWYECDSGFGCEWYSTNDSLCIPVSRPYHT